MKSIVVAGILVVGLQGLPALVGPLVPDSAGTVTGIVRRADTSQPIADVQVFLAPSLESLDQPSTRTEPRTSTDWSGKFTLKGVMPGRYVLVVQGEGYFSLSGDTGSEARATRDIAVNEGQQTDAGALELIPGAAISGRVDGPDGQPLIGAVIQAFRASYVRGRLVFDLAKTVRTNDLGEYRMFWLPPGQYYIRGQYRLSSDDRHERYEPLFFPGLADVDAAPPIRVGPGAESAGIDLRLSVTPINGVTIAGRVVTSTDQQELGVSSVYLLPRDQRVRITGDDADAFPNQATDISHGNFEIRNVSPGAYDLFPVTQAGDTRALPASVDVTDHDIKEISTTLESTMDLRGHVTLDGNKPRDLVLDSSILLVPFEEWPGKESARKFPIRPDPDTGEFTLQMPHGRYAFQTSLFGLPGIYISEVKMGQDTIFDRGLTVGGELREPLEITLKSQGGTVSGTVLDSSRLRSYLYSTVVLVPNRSRRQNFALYKRAFSTNGTFTFKGIAPGDYKVFAWATVVPGAWENPSFIERFEDRGATVTVAEGAQSNIQVPVIP